MEKTNMEYMSEPTRVERTLQRLIKMTLHELKDMQQKNREYLGWCMDAVAVIENLDKEKAETMSYMDIICFLYNSSGDARYESTRSEDGTTCSGSDWQDFTFKMLAKFLLDAQTRNIPIRFFMSLPLKAFYGYLERISQDTFLPRECQAICRQYTELKSLLTTKMVEADEATIADVLTLCERIIDRAWSPTRMSLKSYGQYIVRAHCILGWLLARSFKLAFPQQFCIERIRKEYTGNLKKGR